VVKRFDEKPLKRLKGPDTPQHRAKAPVLIRGYEVFGLVNGCG
jgi:hypothetical protein